MNNTNPPQLSNLKTVGLSTFLYCSERPLFQVCPGLPIGDALAQASDLLSLAKAFAEDAAYSKDSDRHAWAAHYLTAMGKAVVDDVVQALAA
ncbi:DUF3077 domain-containing protein [Pseudomonas protegens]|uniref:DUF3077 domain-containing protein n=1 Tax=Pseudomonas protegens TaxID=380021 RepID=A0A7G7XGS4_9PSED|nr:DUF3077 domain-containing protein [Pseudomonas protegens]QNH79169.1 DUF3077 domain-containing protein [Pseudomonas protegens]QNL08366.1 DUF3077 domain-containing protein [Pseudomonas protegens]